MTPEPLLQLLRHPQRYVWLALAAVAFSWLWLFPYSQALNNPNERTRVLQAHAMAWRGELSIGRLTPRPNRPKTSVDPWLGVHRRLFVNDVAVRCDDPDDEAPECRGSLYPAKGPGSALLAAPGLFALRVLGVDISSRDHEPKLTRLSRLFGATLPSLAGLFGLVLYWRRYKIPPDRIAVMVLAAGFGTSLFPYSMMLVGHATAGAALLWGALLIGQAFERERAAPALWGGALVGLSVLLEYHAALAAVMIAGVFMLMRPPRRVLLGFGAGAGASAVVFAVLHKLMFRSSLRTGHYFLVSTHNRASQESGFLGLSGLNIDSIYGNLFDPYVGLTPTQPWLVFVTLALLVTAAMATSSGGSTRTAFSRLRLGYSRLIRRERATTNILITAVIAYVVFLLTMNNWRVMNGWSIGPRYLIPAMFPAVALAGRAWHRVALSSRWAHAILCGLAAASVVAVGALTLTYPSPPDRIRAPFAELALPLLRAGYGVDSVGGVFSASLYSLAPVMALLFLSCGALLIHATQRSAPLKRQLSMLAIAALSFTLWLSWLGSSTHTSDARLSNARDQVVNTAEGVTPAQTRPQ